MHLTLPAHASRPRLLPRLWATFSLYSQRRAMLALDDHLLNDIGLTRPEVLAEASRPIWDAPQLWRR